MKNKRSMVHLEVPIDDAALVAGIRIREPKEGYKPKEVKPVKDEDIIICRCERVTKKDIMDYIKRTGCTDINALKGALRVGLGPCGSKTCNELVMRIFRELGMDPKNLTPGVQRPFTQEVPIGAFVGGDGK
jgi:sarcosine oxidase, subunit alpha